MFVPTVPTYADATVLADTTFKITATANITVPSGVTYAAGSTVPGATCGTNGGCQALYTGVYTVTATNTAEAGPVFTATAPLTIKAGAATKFVVSGFAGGVLALPLPLHRDDAGVVTAEDAQSNVAISYTGTAVFFSTDSGPVSASYAFTAGDAGVHNVIARWLTVGSQSFTATDIATPSITGTQTGIVVSSAVTYATFSPINPIRVLDSRIGLGRVGAFAANTPASFQITGVGAIPAEKNGNIVAVTGNLTVAAPSAGYAVALGQTAAAASSGTSMINFLAGQTVSNGVTVQVSSTGALFADFITSTPGASTNIVFDVTGIFYALDASGGPAIPVAGTSEFTAVNPTRAIDTRSGVGTIALAPTVTSTMVANQPMCFDLSGTIAANAKAVVGNVTVTGATNGWAVNLGPVASASPTTSTINFTGGQTVANSVTVALATGAVLCATFISTPGNTTDLVFDVTGFYALNGQDFFTPVAPTRLVDTRQTSGTMLSGVLSANLPRIFQVASSTAPTKVTTVVAQGAVAISGNLTFTNETSGWAGYVGPAPLVGPATSSINFSANQVISNGITVPLGGGYLYPTYISTAGNTADMVLDVTGFFTPAVIN
jgi:hypothetical protein